jgi:protein-serine/threonine kinase
MKSMNQKIVLEGLDHPFFVKLQFAFHNMAKVYAIVDFMPGGELFYLVRSKGKLEENEAKFYAAEIFLAI